MSVLSVFCIEVEVLRSRHDSLPAECGGAFVNVYLAAADIRSALDLAETSLSDDGYRVHSLEAAFTVDLGEYLKDPEDPNAQGEPEYEDLLQLLDDGSVWYGTFHCYPPDEAPERLH